MSTGGRKQQYFIPGEGIAREVIQADVCKYLDNDATVRPGQFNGVDGYFIFAYRNFTNEMVADLRNDSTKWLREKQEIQRKRTSPRGASSNKPRANPPEPKYINSDTYEYSRQREQAHRDSYSDTPAPGSNYGYPGGQGPPPVGYDPGYPEPQPQQYMQQPSMPRGNPQYGGQPNQGYGPDSRYNGGPVSQNYQHQGYQEPGYQGGYPEQPGYQGGYPSGYPQGGGGYQAQAQSGYPPQHDQRVMDRPPAPGRGYPQGYAQPQLSRSQFEQEPRSNPPVNPPYDARSGEQIYNVQRPPSGDSHGDRPHYAPDKKKDKYPPQGGRRQDDDPRRHR